MKNIKFLLLIIVLCSCPLLIKSVFEVHLIPHSHMDPGWGWTVDDYYNTRVVNVYNTVYDALQESSSRTFVVCEIIFFKRWYKSKSSDIQSNVKNLVSNKQIEFVGAGWVMHDEANSFYQDQIDQLRLGVQFVKEEFNVDVETAWSLDPFGHSSGNVYVLSQLGYKQIVIDRIHYQDIQDRIKQGNLEFIYRPFNNTNSKELLYHVLGYHYGTKVCNFCYGYSANSDSENDIKNAAENFIRRVSSEVRNGYKNKNIYMHLIGGDFHYTSINNFIGSEKVIEYLNSHEVDGEKIKILFSTPARYFQRIKEEQNKLNIHYKIEEDMDFYVYAEKKYSYWSGYFASRPYLKGIIRKASNMLITSSKIISDFIFKNTFIEEENIIKLQGVVGNLQHHDAITGTSNNWVNNDFINKAKDSINSAESSIKKLITNTDERYNNKNLLICMSNPIIDYGCNNIFSIQKDDQIFVELINPLIDQPLLINIEIRDYEKNKYEVYYSSNLRKKIKSDFYCIPKSNEKFQYENKCFLSFIYKFNSMYLFDSIVLKRTNIPVPKIENLTTENSKIIQNGNKTIKELEYDLNENEFKVKIMQKGVEKSYKFSLLHARFTGFGGKYNDNITTTVRNINNDGMYVFSPREEYPVEFNLDISNSFMIRGKLSTNLFFRFNSSYLIAHFYDDPLFVKIDHIIDSFQDSNGFNYVFLLSSNIDNNILIDSDNEGMKKTHPEFWTDSNGMQMMRRFSGYIPKYNHTFEEKVAINFYPVTTAISIREKDSKEFTKNRYDNMSPNDRMITIFNDKPQAGGALREGEIMLIIDRNSNYDDGKGIGCNNFEEQSARKYFKISHIMMFGNSIYTNDEDGVNSLNFMYNYFHNSPLIFKDDNNLKVKSKIFEIFTLSDNVVFTSQIKKKDEIIIQLYCNYDYYFSNKENMLCMASIDLNQIKDFDIRIDNNGFENEIENEQKFPEMFKNKRFDIFIGHNDFVFIYLKYKKS